MMVKQDSHLIIQLCELLFIQTGIILLRELFMISALSLDFSYHLELCLSLVEF